MENEALFPLIRNQYFFGKLLTQRDMEAEQTYFNNKRRLLNALLYGPGVVCGLGVIRVDGAVIAVESGLALDGLGRELAVDKPIITSLSELNGFEGDRGVSPYVYLCAEYAETPREPMHALADAALAGDRFGRTEEGVRLYLRYGEPDAGETAHSLSAGVSHAEWRNEPLDKKLERGAQVRIYLARIYLVRWEEAYEIDRIESLPFGQAVAVPTADALCRCPHDQSPSGPGTDAERPDSTQREEPPETEPPDMRETPAVPPPALTFGTVRVELSAARFGSMHYSAYIPHGLGTAGACITLGFLTGNGAVYGDVGIFQPAADYDWAAQTVDTDGTFRIGVRVKTKKPERALEFSWMAAAVPEYVCAFQPPPCITVRPGMHRMTARQSVAFSASVEGLADPSVVWSVMEKDGGSITADGYYVASGAEGIFTVRAVSTSDPDINGIALVIVSKG